MGRIYSYACTYTPWYSANGGDWERERGSTRSAINNLKFRSLPWDSRVRRGGHAGVYMRINARLLNYSEARRRCRGNPDFLITSDRSAGMLRRRTSALLYRVFNANSKWYKIPGGVLAILTFFSSPVPVRPYFPRCRVLLSTLAEGTLRERFFILFLYISRVSAFVSRCRFLSVFLQAYIYVCVYMPHNIYTFNKKPNEKLPSKTPIILRRTNSRVRPNLRRLTPCTHMFSLKGHNEITNYIERNYANMNFFIDIPLHKVCSIHIAWKNI